MTTYGIDDSSGQQITSGVQGERVARKMAQRMANERGRSVYLYPVPCSEDDAGEEISPEPTATLPEVAAVIEHTGEPDYVGPGHIVQCDGTPYRVISVGDILTEQHKADRQHAVLVELDWSDVSDDDLRTDRVRIVDGVEAEARS